MCQNIHEYPEIAVMILNHNGLKYLNKCLSSLNNDLYSNKIIYILDNNSTDKSVDYVYNKYPTVNIMQFKENYGFSYSYDYAIRSLKNKYIAILNNDTYVHEMWLSELYKNMKEKESIGICGSKMLDYLNQNIIDHAGGLINVIGGGNDIGKGEMDYEKFNKSEYVGFACGGAALINKDAYLSIGGFDPKYFLYHEDVDLCWRLWQSGFRVLYVPSAIVYHIGGGTSGDIESPFRIYHSQKSRLRCLFKNSDIKNLLKGIAVSIIFDVVRSIKYAIKGEFKCLGSIWRANWYVIKNCKDICILIKGIKKRESLKNIEKKYMYRLTISLIDSIKDYCKI